MDDGVLSMSKPYGITIFADDIRQEEDGKSFIIGVYSDGLDIPQVPVMVPTFAFLIKLLEPIEFKGRTARIKIFGPSESGPEVIFDQELDASRWDITDSNDFDPEAEYVGSSLIIRASPLPVKAPGYFRVRAYYDDEEIKLGSLRIGYTPAE